MIKKSTKKQSKDSDLASKPLKPDLKNSKISKSSSSDEVLQSIALQELAFASSDDENNEEDSADSDDLSDNEEFHGFDTIPPLNDDIKHKVAKQMSKSTPESDKKGIVYVGRIPHGFYETQMKDYFSQFGEISRLRLSRNKKTGHSKHYAFIEFQSSQVAKVVADTMDSYLLFGRILNVKLISPEKIHSSMFKGANKTYRTVPWTLISKRLHDKPKSKQQLEKLEQKFKKSNEEKSNKLKELGIEYSLTEKPAEKRSEKKTEKPPTKRKSKK